MGVAASDGKKSVKSDKVCNKVDGWVVKISEIAVRYLGKCWPADCVFMRPQMWVSHGMLPPTQFSLVSVSV